MADKPPLNGAVANGKATESKTDLALIWEAAVNDYERRTRMSLRLAPWRSMYVV
jgi:hypothetical protein